MCLRRFKRVIALVVIVMLIGTSWFNNMGLIGNYMHAYAESSTETFKPAVNLVNNPDFELINESAPTDVIGWEKDLDKDSGHSGQTLIDKGSGCDGTNSIRIGSDEGGRGQIINNVPENTSYILSGWGKVSTTGAIIYLGVDCLDDTGKKIPGGKFGLEFGGNDYKNLTRPFTTKSGTAKLQVYVYKDKPTAEGKVEYGYIDNISIVQTGESPVTDKLLKNADFEVFNSSTPEAIDGWDNWGNTIIEKGIGCDGTHAVKIGVNEGGAGQSVDNILPGTSYSITGWGKTSIQGTTDAAIIGVDCLDNNAGKIAGGKFSVTFSDTEYTKKSLTFKTVEGTNKLLIYIYKNPGDGYAYLDNISLVKIGGGEPERGYITPTKPADGVFYDDFTNGIDPSKWLIGKAQWGGTDANGGVIPENVAAKDGVVEITGNGDLYNGPIKGINNDRSLRNDGKRTGGVITTKDFYGSGSYEVKAKILPQLGACSAFWTYFNDGDKNHEIDIEIPAQKTINKLMTNCWVVEANNTTNVVDTPKELGTDKGINDGEWHTYRFDWHTDPAKPRVEYYIDGKHVFTSTTNIPFAAGRFWAGVWFPNNWAGVPNFNTDKMLIDWIKITPFNESGDQWLKNYDSTWADLTEYPPMKNSSSSQPVNTHNITYLSIDEMNDKRTLTDDSIKDFVKQLEQYSIEYQFCDMGFFDTNGKLPASDTDKVNQWIRVSRATCPGQKIIATINGELGKHVTSSEEMRQCVADECKKLVDKEGYNFDGIQVDMEPFRAESNADLVDLLKKIRTAIGDNKHLSIATTPGQRYLPDKDITAIADVVDMINPMVYDSNGSGAGEVKTTDEFINFWKNTVLRFSNAIAKSSNTDCQLNPTMPVYEKKGYISTPGWPDADSNLVVYHLPSIENIHNAVQGLKQAINAGAKVYGSGIFWWGCFTGVEYDKRDGQDYAKDRKWWLEDWVNTKTASSDTVKPDNSDNSGQQNTDIVRKEPVITKEGNVPKVQLDPVFDVKNGKAASIVDSKLFAKLYEQSEKDNNGIRKIVLDVQKVENAKSYSVKFDGISLNSDKAEKSVEIRTQFANCTIRDNMLGNTKSDIKSIELSIGTADKSKLTEEIRKTIGDRPAIELRLLLDGKPTKWNNPDASVKVAVKYTPKADELKAPEHITVWYIGDDGKVIPVTNGRYDSKTGMVTFAVTHFSSYAIANVFKTFDDIAKYDWAKKQIEVLTSKGIISGTSETSFSPEAAVSRAEFAALLVKTLSLTAGFEDNFNDVKINSDYYEELGVAKKLGIIKGVGNNNLDSDADISRQDMMVMTYRALMLNSKELKAGVAVEVNAYSDMKDISGYAADSVAAIIKSGIVQGNGSCIVPKGKFTKAEAAVLLYKLYSLCGI